MKCLSKPRTARNWAFRIFWRRGPSKVTKGQRVMGVHEGYEEVVLSVSIGLHLWPILSLAFMRVHLRLQRTTGGYIHEGHEAHEGDGRDRGAGTSTRKPGMAARRGVWALARFLCRKQLPGEKEKNALAGCRVRPLGPKLHMPNALRCLDKAFFSFSPALGTHGAQKRAKAHIPGLLQDHAGVSFIDVPPKVPGG